LQVENVGMEIWSAVCGKFVESPIGGKEEEG